MSMHIHQSSWLSILLPSSFTYQYSPLADKLRRTWWVLSLSHRSLLKEIRLNAELCAASTQRSSCFRSLCDKLSEVYHPERTNSESTLHGKLFINKIKRKGTTRFINIRFRWPPCTIDPTYLRGWSCWTVLGTDFGCRHDSHAQLIFLISKFVGVLDTDSGCRHDSHAIAHLPK